MSKQEYFQNVVSWLHAIRKGNEDFLINFNGEQSDFCRFNQGKVRQIGEVVHDIAFIQVQSSQKQLGCRLTLSGDEGIDRSRIQEVYTKLRQGLKELTADPYLQHNDRVFQDSWIKSNKLPSLEQWTQDIQKLGLGKDMVGIFAQGGLFRGFASSRGQNLWHENYSFHFDWSLYHEKDKAVKSSYAGFEWDHSQFERKMLSAQEQLAILSQPAKSLNPGVYRAYLAPAALAEIFGLLEWRGFGLKQLKTRSSPLRKLYDGEAHFSPLLHVSENIKGGVAPAFDPIGLPKNPETSLIKAGKFASAMVSARSAVEYSQVANGANEDEIPESLCVRAGSLPLQEVLEKLGTGIYINNLWYLNFSDLDACRMTGMTRFACFWVENGRLVAPIDVMRFDESLYRLLGSHLIDLTSDCEMLLSSSTYEGRSVQSQQLPGALVSEFNLTL